MKQIKIIFLTAVISFLFINCGGTKTNSFMVIHKDSTAFAVGDAQVKYSTSGAHLDYFIPGAIIALKTDFTILKQKGKAGKIYQISGDTILNEIESFDISLNDSTIARKYLVNPIESY